MTDSGAVDVSVIIVNYNVKHFAGQCLRSVQAASRDLTVEIFVIDNNSQDNSLTYLRPLFPSVHFIENRENVGFGRANNQGLQLARGRYFLILNPDTLIAEDTLSSLSSYLDSHPEAGAAGPKILTRDGGYDFSSKRGLPTPWVAFCRLSGLSRLFPQSRIFGRYDLRYLDPDKPAAVDALAGSAMMVRREILTSVGGFDEDFFMYGEDLDWCYRIQKAGWEIHYAPVTRIIHFRGESTRRSEIDRDRAFYGAMHLFVDKHFRSKSPIAAHWLISLGIVLAEAAARTRRHGARFIWVILDAAAIWLALILSRWLRWGALNLDEITIGAMLLQTVIWAGCLALAGAYGQGRGQRGPVAAGMALGFLANSSMTYFVKPIAFSRLMLLLALPIGAAFVFLWRTTLGGFKRSALWRKLYQRRTLIVGAGPTARALIANLSGTASEHVYRPVGLVDPDEQAVGSIIDGLPVIGGESELPSLIAQEEIEEVLFAYDQADYNRVLHLVGQIGNRRGINFKVITPEIVSQPDGLAPLLSLEYLAPRGIGGSLKKISTLVTKG